MPTERLSMRRIREVLRLRHQGLTERVIARMLGVSNGVVHGYLRRARLAGLSWPLPEGLDDAALELLLFPPAAASQATGDRRPIGLSGEGAAPPQRDPALLWEEYRGRQSGRLWLYLVLQPFEAWKKRVRPTMRQTHIGGEKVFVDFAGDTIDIFDPITGEVHAMKLFVAAMGASNYTYAEACPSESLPTGSACIPICSGFSAACRSSWSAIISRPPSPTPIATIPVSTEPTPRWPAITAPRSSRRGRAAQRTRQRLRSPSRSPSVGSWPVCAISVSFPWRNSTPPSPCSSSNSTPARCAASAPAAPNSSPRSTVRSWETAGPALRLCALEALPCRPRLSCRDRRSLVFHPLSPHP